MPSALALVLAPLLALAGQQGDEPSFFFDRSGDVGTFAVEVPWPPGAATVRLHADDPGLILAVPAERRISDSHGDVARFAGRYARPGLVSFALEGETASGARLDLREISAPFPASASSPDAREKYARCLLDELSARMERSGGDAFLATAHEIVRRRHGLSPDAAPRPRSSTPPLPPLALYDVFSGAIALQESLQLDALFSEAPPDSRDRDPAMLPGPKIESHPFERWLGELATPAPEAESSALAVPHDFLCARFRSIDAMARAAEKLEGWGSTFLAAAAAPARRARLRERLEEQIRFSLDADWRRVLDPSLASVSIVSSDPYFREGNDVTILLELKGGEEPAEAAASVARLAQSGAGLETSERTIAGVAVRSVTSRDRTVSSHVAASGSFLVISNSLAAIEAVLRTIVGERRSLGSLPEYRYMRSLLPLDGGEDGFVYLSDAFVRRVVGPTLKILEARRASCLARRSALASAALLFRMENGRAPRDVGELEGLAPRAAECPDGGAIALDSTRSIASCPTHGTGARSTPCLELACGRVSEREAGLYDRFARDYNNYWRRYFDPVGVRLRLRDGARLETVILPLIELSAYNSLKDAVGAARSRPLGPASAPGEVYRLSGRFEAERLVRMALFFPGVDVGDVAASAREALTGAFAISRFDGEPLVEFVAGDYLSRLLRTGASFDLALVPLLSAVTAPTAVTLATTDEASAARFIEAARRALARASVSGRALGSLPTVRHYVLDRPPGATPVDSVSIEALSFRLRFFFARADGRIVVANRLDVLESLLGAPAEANTALEHDLELSIRAGEVTRSRPFLEIGQAEAAREACVSNLEPLTSLLEFGGVAPAAIEAETLRRFGEAFACPEGGAYSLDSAARAARCSRHGTIERPMQGEKPTGAAARLFSTLRDTRVRLRFTDEGIRTEIDVR